MTDENENTRVKDALGYLEQGWALVPLYGISADGCACSQGDGCGTPNKHPVIGGWREADNQIRTIRQVERAWGSEGDPNRNIGIITGTPSGLFAVDIDPKNGGEDALERLQADHQPFPYTRVHRTGSGGHHYLFRMPENQDISNSNKNLKDAGYRGIDIRGTGGYIVAPSSVTNKGDYRVSTRAPVGDAPAWLLDLLLTPKAASSPKIDRSSVGEYETFPDAIKRQVDSYCAKALASEMQRFEDERTLEGWDNLTNEVSFACLMIANSPWNAVDPGAVEAELYERANDDDEGFPFSRVEKCVNSAWRAIESKDLMRDLPPSIQTELDQLTAKPKKVSKSAVKTGDRTTKLVSAADITMRRAKWLWKGRIALGTLALVAGQAGLGKSTFVYWLVAQLTRGTLFGEFEGTSRSVIICATEDSWEHTIVPRLVASGADRTKVFRVDVTSDSNDYESLNLVKDHDALEILAKENNIGLLVLDPLMSRMGEGDSHKDFDVRKTLEPMCALADKGNFAIIGIMHHNKASGNGNPLVALMGSTAFGAVARSVHTVIPETKKDEDGEPSDRRILGTIKNNLGKTSGAGLNTWAFRIETVEFETEDDDPQPLSIGKLVWDGNVDETIESIMSQGPGGGSQSDAGSSPSRTAEAENFLRNLFTREGVVTKARAIEVGAMAINGEHKQATLYRVMKSDEFAKGKKTINGEPTACWGFAEDMDEFEES